MILSKNELIAALVGLLLVLGILVFGVVKPVYEIHASMGDMIDRVETLESMAHPSEKRK